MTDPRDVDLERRFAALRAEDARVAPPFATPAARRRRGTRFALWVGAAAAATTAAIVLFVAVNVPEREPYPVDLADATWRGPTDFLLEVPGAELLRSVPRIGRVDLADSILAIDRRTP